MMNRALRLRFCHADRADVVLGQPVVQIGSAHDNDVVLADSGAAAHHASLHFRCRSVQLHVRAGCERVHVNARPVHQLALLRLGDVLSVAGCKLVLLPPADDLEMPRAHAAVDGGKSRDGGQPWGLRCIAGLLPGRFLAVGDQLLLDRALLPEAQGCLRIWKDGQRLQFAVPDGSEELPACNGLAARQGRLQSGDQLLWGRHRFEVIGPSPASPAASQPQIEPEDSAHEPDERRHHDLLWLLVVAALLAAGIALLLLLRQ